MTNSPCVPATMLNPVVDFISHSVAQTQRIGARLGELLRPSDVILLEGDFGAGKTCLAQGIARGLGLGELVNSPAFTLINEYPARDYGSRLTLYHIDVYRLSQPVAELLDLGIDEYLYGQGVCVVEWAERVVALMPPDHLAIKLKFISETKRGIRMQPSGNRYVELLHEFRKRAFGR